MGSTERSGAFWSTFGTVTSKSEVNKRQLHREQRLHLRRRRTGGEERRRRRRRQPRQRPTLRGPRRTSGGAGVYSRFGRMEIWDCSILGCAPRRCSVIAEPDFFPLFHASQSLSSSSFPSSTTSSSSSPSFVFPPVLTLTYKCMYACASDCPYLSRSIFSFSSVLFLPSLSLYDETNEGIFNPANHQRGIELRISHFSYWSSSFYSSSFFPTTRETNNRRNFSR